MASKLIVHQGAERFSASKGTVITIGTFDGVHLGHKTILRRVVESAKALGLESVLLTFFPHPRMVVQQQTDLKLLNTLEEKKDHLTSIGLDHLVVQPFTAAFSRLTAVEYVRDILVHQLGAKKIIIGYDHRFGRNRTAHIEDLIAFGKLYDFAVEEISAQELNTVAISSTKIRKALEAGSIEMANSYLDYTYRLNGHVVRGKSIGRSIGYPTANLNVDQSYKLIPKEGVYLTQTKINNQILFGLTNIGTNPTVGGDKQTIETFFLEVTLDLYDAPLQLSFLERIRDQKHFSGIDALKAAIENDVLEAKRLLSKYV
ncbi:MAG: riboflavin biosynthesis protein RibF [Cryomorphaceae bacterium BACL21 MAG-121220-bin10]|jgi:riboflavin kinase / FMN adenylyltransferase|nr:MAG: riboflavin biosynthesis protein RibF [Cryomorphaceae bacterium BACL21 MAG-121220-bin10]MDA0700932.1 bifunctional riboflavin kinase/FAD synthetase [Bacteroidota bacterium]